MSEAQALPPMKTPVQAHQRLVHEALETARRAYVEAEQRLSRLKDQLVDLLHFLDALRAGARPDDPPQEAGTK